jgi:hypothetical protein
MRSPRVRREPPAGLRGAAARALRGPAAALFTAFVLLFAQSEGQARQAATALGGLRYFKAYFGNFGHVSGAVGLSGLGDRTTGLATGTINISGVPATADIAAAFLYWETMSDNTDITGDGLGKFTVGNVANDIVGKQITPDIGSTSGVYVPSCYGAGGGSGTTQHAGNLHVYVSDVLRFLPPIDQTKPVNPVNTSYVVQLPDSGSGGSQSTSSGNQLIRTEGASLLIVYRDKTRPFAAEVIYHGGQTQDANHTAWSLTLQGFYQASGQPGNLIMMVGDGDQSKTETLNIQGSAAVPNPFRSTAGPGWDTRTFPLNTVANQSTLGLSVTEPTAVDCLSYVAAAANIPVVDTDSDGIIDLLETSTAASPIRDPNGNALPPLGDMGAVVGVPDIFVEFAYLTAPAGLTYGYPGQPQVTTAAPHSHLPTKTALDMVARAFKNANIAPHFDVGNNYQPASLPNCSTAWTPDCAIIPAALAKGGKNVAEAFPWCGTDNNGNPVNAANCQFAYYPGTIGWKSGYQFFRDQVFGFDPTRLGIFHFVFAAHALGLPRALCLDDNGNPDLNCQSTNPLFHVPRTNSGMGDVGGGDVLLTTGGFGNNFVGQDPVVAGTIAHELGHNLERRHAGDAFSPNCKPNYLSVMNYVYQFGLSGPDGPEIAFSLQQQNSLNENGLKDLPLSPAPVPAYAIRWYAPAATAFISSGLSLTPVSKHCDGSLPSPGDPQMVRVEAVIPAAAIDWNADGILTTAAAFAQDVNFNSGPNNSVVPNLPSDGPFTGSNDLPTMLQIGLRQVGSRPNAGLFSLDVTEQDLGRGDPGRGDPGRGDPGRGDPGRGDPGRGDPGRGDPGRGDPGRGDPGAPPGDLDLTTAAAANGGPYTLKAVVNKVTKTIDLSWKPPLAINEDRSVQRYVVYRVLAGSVTPDTFSKRDVVGQTNGNVLTLKDTKVSPGKTYTYWVIAELDNGTRTGISNFATQIFQ